MNVSALDPQRRGASVSERLRGGREEASLDVLPSIADALLAEGDRPQWRGPLTAG